MRALVIGCGVSGLTSAVRLLEAGHSVAIRARELPPHTTSNVAAAFWYPYKASPPKRVTGWARESWLEFHRLSTESNAGVTFHPTLELFRQPAADPWWRAAVPDFRRPAAHELPAGYSDGYSFTAPVIDTRRYLPYLMERVRAGGVVIERREVRDPDRAFAEADVVVNCAGLGARELTGDRSLVPIRGEVVRLEDPGLDRVLIDEHGPDGITYIIPRGTDCVVGGTAEPGREDLDPDPEEQKRLIERCRKLEPRLAPSARLGAAVGLRPGRPSVRLEPEKRPGGGLVVHNYGHGGAGVTLSWGCAAEVVRFVETAGPDQVTPER